MLDRDYPMGQYKEMVQHVMQIYDSYMKVQGDASHSIVKSTLMMVELF